jgi:hypothetical protein
MDNRDINVNAIDTLHHVQGLSHISKSVDREEQRKGKKKRGKDEQDIQQFNKDEKLEEELKTEEEEVLADEDMDHIDFRA